MTQFDPKKLGKEADELIRKQSQANEAGETPIEETPAIEPPSDEEALIAIAQAESTPATDQGVRPSEAPADEARTDTSEALGAMQKQLDAAEQRWKVLQGMIDKKDREIEAMRDLLARMNEQPAAQPLETPAPAAPAKLVTDSDIQEYGQDYVDFITRVSKQTLTGELSTLPNLANIDSRLQALEGTVQGVEQTSANTAQSLFTSELTVQVPEWRTLNTDPAFLQWLENVDQFAGETRMDLLQHAVANGDAARAATFFNAYKVETAPPPPEIQEPDTPAATGKDALVAPGKTKATPPTPDAKRNWTRTEIAKLYDDKMAGRINQKTFDKLERDLFAAQREGRVSEAA